MLGIVTPPPASPEPEPTEPEPTDTSTAPVSDSEAKVAEPAPSETKPDEQQEPTSVTDEAKKSDDQELEGSNDLCIQEHSLTHLLGNFIPIRRHQEGDWRSATATLT